MLDFDFSGRISQAEVLPVQSLKVEIIDTLANKNESQICSTTVKIECEEDVKDEVLSVSTTSGTATSGKIQPWSGKQWSTVPFFGSVVPFTSGGYEEIVDNGVSLRKHPENSKSNLDTPSLAPVESRVLHRVPSKSTFDVPLLIKDADNTPRVTIEDADDAESATNNHGSLISPGSDSSADDSQVFDAPQAKTFIAHDVFTPPTPPSVHKLQHYYFGNESPSPAERKIERPVPRRFPHLKKESTFSSSSFTVGQQEEPENGDCEDTSNECIVSDDAPIGRKNTALVREEREFRDTAVETKFIDIKIEGDNTEHERCQDVPRAVPLLKEADLTSSSIDALRDIFGTEMITEIKQGRHRCYGFTKQGPRCTKHIAKSILESARRRLLEAHSRVSPLDLINELLALVEALFCYYHISEAKMKAESWICSQSLSTPIPTAYDDSLLLKQEPQRRDSDEAIKRDHEKVSTSVNSFLQIFPSKSSYVEGIDRCTPWQPQNIKNLSVKSSLAKWVVQPLEKNGGKSGFLYIYSTTGDIGTRKIGLTKHENIEVRFKAWRKCGQVVNLVYPKKEYQAPFEHVYRLERLVHTELKNFRLKKTRCICGKTHVEWSHAPDALITAVILKWGKWLDSKPYEKVGDNWQLKDGFFNLEDVCTPCPMPKIAVPSRLSTPNLTTASRSRIPSPGTGMRASRSRTPSSIGGSEARAERGQTVPPIIGRAGTDGIV
ncbi:hypothetical protein MMC34_006691 [Xylographa carneopallida]|nr:hypothetical protein [Xylographa carneopallida]